MKSPFGIALVATSFLAISSLALADSQSGRQSFESTNQTQFTASWSVNVDFNQAQGHQTETVTGVGISVGDSDQLGSQAVIDNNCKNVDGTSYKNTYKCNLAPLNNESSESFCSITGSFLIQDSYEGSGAHVTCTQDIAIVMHDGSWLVDPYHKDDPSSEVQHDFLFSMIR